LDLHDTIRQLRIEKEKLEIVIVELERLQAAGVDDADADVKPGTESAVKNRRGSCRPSAGKPVVDR